MKLGLSTCGKVLDRALFAAYAEAGITHMEISLEKEVGDVLDYAQAKAWAEEFSVTLCSQHLPFSPFAEINIASPAIAAKTIAYFTEVIGKATEIGISRFVVHPSAEPIEPEVRAEQMNCAQESLAKLAEIADQHGAIIAVENLPRTCLGRNSEEILALVSADPRLRVCFDTNHLLGEDPLEFIAKVGHLFVTTHVSDYDFINERHWLPGEGQLDWPAILSALKAVGYDGPWLYELRFRAPKTLTRPRDLTCADFARNFTEVTQGQPLTVLGRSLL